MIESHFLQQIHWQYGDRLIFHHGFQDYLPVDNTIYGNSAKKKEMLRLKSADLDYRYGIYI